MMDSLYMRALQIALENENPNDNLNDRVDVDLPPPFYDSIESYREVFNARVPVRLGKAVTLHREG